MSLNTMTALADQVRRLEIAVMRRPTLPLHLELERARVRYLRAQLRLAAVDGFIARSPMARRMMETGR